MSSAPATTPKHIDGRVIMVVLLPGLALAAAFYWGDAPEIAYGIAGLTALISIIAAPEVGLYLFFFATALDELLLEARTDVFTPTKALGPIILLVYLFHPQRVRAPMRISKPFILAMLGFGVYGMLTAAWAYAPYAALRYGAQVIVLVLLTIVVLHRLTDRARIERALLATLGGGLAATAILLVYGSLSTHVTRATLGEWSNPNTTGLILTFATLTVPGIWAYTRLTWLRPALLGLAFLLIPAMLRTGSRSSMLAVVLAPVLGVMVARKGGIMLRIIVPSIAVALALVTTVWVLNARVLDKQSQARIELLKEGQLNRSEARHWIWVEGFELFMQQPWGFGFGNSAFAFQQHKGIYKDIHSSIFGPLVDGGVIAATLYYYAIFYLFRQLRRVDQRVHGIPAMILFMGVFLWCATHTIHFSKYFWVPLMLILAMVEQSVREAGTVPSPADNRLTREDLLRNLSPNDVVVYS